MDFPTAFDYEDRIVSATSAAEIAQLASELEARLRASPGDVLTNAVIGMLRAQRYLVFGTAFYAPFSCTAKLSDACPVVNGVERTAEALNDLSK